jgi:hypothetical protein
VCLGCAACATVDVAAPVGRSTTPALRPVDCVGFSLSLAEDAVGVATPDGALRRFLASHPVGYPETLSAWHASPSDPLVFMGGTARVTVLHLAAPGSGYLVVGGTTC